MNNTLVPDNYDIQLGEDCVLHVRTRETPSGDRPGVTLHWSAGYLSSQVTKDVEEAVLEVASLLEEQAGALRRIACRLPTNKKATA